MSQKSKNKPIRDDYYYKGRITSQKKNLKELGFKEIKSKD